MFSGTDPFKKQLQLCVTQISNDLDADLFVYSAPINTINADRLIKLVQEWQDQFASKNNVVLALTTNGGDPHAAFRIARFLQKTYNKFITFVFGYCKSAGTLIVVGAHEIVMSDFAEIGPLDIQISRDDNLFRRSSGLDLRKTVDELASKTSSVFSECFLSIVVNSEGLLTTKMSAEIASSMVTGILSPITSQIDPVRLGEVHRSIDVTYEYGIRLNPKMEKAIKTLVLDYPAHEFVIDRYEADELGFDVRIPNENEIKLQNLLPYLRIPNKDTILSLNSFIVNEDIGETENPDENANE